MYQREWIWDLIYLAWHGNDPLSSSYDQLFCDMPITGPTDDGIDAMGCVLMGGEL